MTATRAGVHRSTAAVVAAASIAAFSALWTWAASPASRYLDHHGEAVVDGSVVVRLAPFAAAWLLMTVATMLPTALPLLGAFERLTAHRADRRRLTGFVVGGFVSVWAAAGGLAALADAGLHELVEATPLHDRPRLTAAAALALAAAYQLSPLALRCLRACRSPFGFVGRHWTGAADVGRQAFAVGADYGRSCLGCCAALMAVMAGVGMANPAWMLGLGAVTAVQKSAPGGTRLARPVGFVLAAAAVAVATGAA